MKRLSLILAIGALAAAGIVMMLQGVTVVVQVRFNGMAEETAEAAQVATLEMATEELRADKGLNSPPTQAPIPTAVLNTPALQPLPLEEVVEQVKRSVVKIYSDEGTGTGIIITDQGLIVTNHHVLGDDTNPVIELHDGRRTIGQVLKIDARTDLALIDINEDNLQPATLGDSDDLRQGQEVVALGFPLDGEVTVTSGIISATQRQVSAEESRRDLTFLQTDAAINRGNSGGPLVNRQGQVMGIVTSKQPEAENVSFATPVNLVKDAIARILATD